MAQIVAAFWLSKLNESILNYKTSNLIEKNNTIIFANLTAEQLEDISKTTFLTYSRADVIVTIVFQSILLILGAFIAEKYKKKLFETQKYNFFCYLVLASVLIFICNFCAVRIFIN